MIYLDEIPALSGDDIIKFIINALLMRSPITGALRYAPLPVGDDMRDS